jgi:membrane-associated phospholipid phosphatase
LTFVSFNRHSLTVNGTRWIWFVIVVVVASDAIWMSVDGLSPARKDVEGLLFAVGTLCAIAYFYYRTRRADPIMRAANSAAQLVSFTASAAALSYLVAATNAPLVDAAFATIDHSIGFDWRAWTEWVQAHRLIHWTFVLAYGSLLFQMVGCTLFLALQETAEEFLTILIVSGLLTIAISGFLPAMGNLVDAPHVPHFHALRAGTLHVIPLGRGSQGLIAFPSFHAALALLVAYAVRKNRWTFIVACVLNFLVILSTLSEGGHYLVDVIGGIAVAALSIWMTRRLRRPSDASALKLTADR